MDTKGEYYETIKDILSDCLKWIGIVVCILSLVSFFISSEWIIKTLFEVEMEHSIMDDSDASTLIKKVEIYMLEFAFWLKELPVVAKIIGAVVGGIIWYFSIED